MNSQEMLYSGSPITGIAEPDLYDDYFQTDDISSSDGQLTWKKEPTKDDTKSNYSPNIWYFDHEDYYLNAGIMADNEGMPSIQYPPSTTWDNLCVSPTQLTSPPSSLNSIPVESEGHLTSHTPIAGCHTTSETITVGQKTSAQQRPAERKKKGNRVCDLNKEKRKIDLPLKCQICEKGNAWKRELDRHYISHHPQEARRMGLDVSRPICKYPPCNKTFARRDHLLRHMRKQHGYEDQ